MTEAEAIALAAKREAHKSKHMIDKRWEARHDPVKGWHATLVDAYSIENNRARLAERRAESLLGAPMRMVDDPFGGMTVGEFRRAMDRIFIDQMNRIGLDPDDGQ